MLYILHPSVRMGDEGAREGEIVGMDTKLFV